MTSPRFVDGIGAFADRYEGFLLDQWGVIHDGRQALPEAVAALAELKRRNKRLVVLSNSGRRAALNRRRLAEMGLNVAMFDAVVTSGEAAWSLLRHRTQPGFRDLGRRCVLFTIGGDRGVLDDLGIEVVERPGGGRLPVQHRPRDPAAHARRLPRGPGARGRAPPAHGLLQPGPGGAVARAS